MANDLTVQARQLLVTAPFKGDGTSLEKLFGAIYPLQLHSSLASLTSAINDQAGVVVLTEEALVGDVSMLGRALEEQAAWSEIPIILLASNKGRLGRATEAARLRLPAAAGHVLVLERPLSSASLISAVAAAWRSRERQFDMRDRLAELAEERSRMHTLLENIPVGVCFMDSDGKSLVSNPRYRRCVPDDVIPSRSPTRVNRWVGHDEHGNLLAPNMFPGARALRGEPVAGLDFSYQTDDGDESWMRVSAIPLYDESQHLIGAASVILDINEEKRSQQSLRRFNEELEIQVRARTQALNAAVEKLKLESDERARAEEQLRQSLKMEAVGQLTGGIAHDFNNMLTGVMSAMELMKLRLAKGKLDGVERFMDAAYSSAQRAASLTQRLLAFSRRQSLDSKPLSVNGLILSLHELLQRTVTEQVSVQLDLCENDPWVCADTNQLENALLNLVINGRDAMPRGGTLTIRTRASNAALEPAREGGFGEAGHVCIDVSDTGVGIPEHLLNKVFEPFFTTKPIGQGTGLGLSMVYGFAKQSDGRLAIDSVENKGTTVSICLPVSDSHSLPAQIPGEMAVAGKGQTILLVEDDDSVRLINQAALVELGYRVVVAREAEEALAQLSNLPSLDLLVTDVGLPGMNGRQLAEVVQQLKPGLPVLFLTGYAEGAMKREDFLGPHMHLLTKPVSLEALASRIDLMLGEQGAGGPREVD